MSAILRSIQVGLPRTYGHEGASDLMDRPWTSAFFKTPLTGSVEVNWSSIVGDGVADQVNHGGPDKAILAYSANHYPAWQAELRLREMPHGGFGENFTIAELQESTVCLGDIWRVGACVFEVSQPRQPCWKLARRWRIKDLPAQVIATGRTGWYLRIQQSGTLEADWPMVLEHRPYPEWTIARANEVFYHQKQDIITTRQLQEVPVLSMSWKEELLARIDRREHGEGN